LFKQMTLKAGLPPQRWYTCTSTWLHNRRWQEK